uniref:Uncharacterized protein n=1 Tax=Molossus molossus TaxID=27622 RepID=A0A7J8JX96_MOLMO|nr:hypothetical protein HJG59_007798 [Molossus molossus]
MQREAWALADSGSLTVLLRGVRLQPATRGDLTERGLRSAKGGGRGARAGRGRVPGSLKHRLDMPRFQVQCQVKPRLRACRRPAPGVWEGECRSQMSSTDPFTPNPMLKSLCDWRPGPSPLLTAVPLLSCPEI